MARGGEFSTEFQVGTAVVTKPFRIHMLQQHDEIYLYIHMARHSVEI